MAKQTVFELGGSRWKLRWRKNLSTEAELGRTLGETHGIERIVYLSSKELAGKPELAKRVLFHELIHALFHMAGLDETLSAKTEETVVCGIENLFWPLIESKRFEVLLDTVAKQAKELERKGGGDG
jgi:hypothetical protein